MPNTIDLSSFAENIFRARDKVARELIGAIPGVIMNSDSDQVSINGTVTSLRSAQPTLNTAYTPAMTIPDGDDQTIAADTVQISQVANVKIPMKGETQRKLDNTAGQQTIDDMFTQALRKIVNAIEAHVCTTLKNGASRATGTAGTTPFTAVDPLADLRKIMVDNGTPFDGDISLVIDTTAGAKLRKVANLYKVNESGDEDLLRRGELSNLMGFSIKESAGIGLHTKGTGAGYLVNGAKAVGITDVIIDTGTGTILPGDILGLQSDANLYVVNSGFAGDGAGTISLGRPGLLAALADNKTLTLGNNYTTNVAFHKRAAELIMRPPAMPTGGDAADDRMTIHDEVSGLVFEIALYRGYGMVMFDITVFYQAKVWKPEFIATLLG